MSAVIREKKAVVLFQSKHEDDQKCQKNCVQSGQCERVQYRAVIITVRNKYLNEKKWREMVTSNLMLLQMLTKVVSYIYTRQSDIEDVDLLNVTLANKEDVKLSGPFDDLFFCWILLKNVLNTHHSKINDITAKIHCFHEGVTVFLRTQC